MRRNFSILLISAVWIMGGCSPQTPAPNKYSETRQLMGTIVQIDLCQEDVAGKDAALLLEPAWARLEEIAWRMNVYDEKSDVARINRARTEPVLTPRDTYDLIKVSKAFSKETQGAFDITIWPLLSLWRDSAKVNTMPDERRVNAIKEKGGADKIILHENDYVQLKDPETMIDLGGIAKGYAIDEAARLLREAGLPRFYIDAGGDLYAAGKNCDRKPWRIGIKHPVDHRKLISVIGVEDASVTTSGNYHQYVVIEGEQFSHIINPITGYPQREVTSATVIAPTATEADALSTALTVLGPAGNALINGKGHGYASLIVTDTNRRPYLHPSQEYKKYQLQ